MGASLQGFSQVIWILWQKDCQQLLVRFPDSIFEATRAGDPGVRIRAAFLLGTAQSSTKSL